MTARAEFDVGPLSWVKGEIDQALQRGQEALRAFAANSADTAQLKSSQTHLHQAHGALSIVGLEGVTRLSEELENLLAGIDRPTGGQVRVTVIDREGNSASSAVWIK